MAEYSISEVDFATFKAAKLVAAENAATEPVPFVVPVTMTPSSEKVQSKSAALSKEHASVQKTKANGIGTCSRMCCCCADSDDDEDSTQKEVAALSASLEEQQVATRSNAFDAVEELRLELAGIAEVSAIKGRRTWGTSLVYFLCNCGKGVFVCLYDLLRTLPVISIAGAFISFLGLVMILEGLEDLDEAVKELGLTADVLSYFMIAFLVYFMLHILILCGSFVASGKLRESCCWCMPLCIVVMWRCLTGLLVGLSFILFWLLFVLWFIVIILLLLWSMAYALCEGGEAAVESFDNDILPILEDYMENENDMSINPKQLREYCHVFEGDTMDTMQQAAGGVGIVIVAHVILMMISVANYYLAVKERSLQKVKNKVKRVYNKAFGDDRKLENAVSSLTEGENSPPMEQVMQ
ncbi:hypothetical protein CYMTET_56572 [Cymbomonas tetramitiformis]|uniref:Uncharacterized protein n=1 Tax=Cymbomonas tetramitiformis TaxID=36881 RepID=A0AAE0EMF6_9CHLO|nr:hypothetical protein CYMTET_56572 [Cymbomonas tetramitiformis]